MSLWFMIQGLQGYLVYKKTQLKETHLQHKGRWTVNLGRPERARNDGSTGPQRFDDTRCTTKRRRINYRGPRKTGACGHQNHSITCKSRILRSCIYRLWTCSEKVALPLWPWRRLNRSSPVPALWFRVKGSGLRVEGWGLRVDG